ncbi:MAG: TlpA family protein disulfide reductase [candidate division KSB1 bacterium]|nr:TlpA family protein disulfide reductase [candidate division KSB1 bacterium]
MKRLMTLGLVSIMVLSLVVPACSKQEKSSVGGSTASAQTKNDGGLDFTIITIDGQHLKLSDFRGKVVIVDFWDTWCPPCRMEIPHFIDLYKQYKGRGFEMIGIAFGREGVEAVKRFSASYNINYTNALATQEILNKVGEINAIPTTFVLDQKGNIYKKYVGYQDKAVFERDIKTLLGL